MRISSSWSEASPGLEVCKRKGSGGEGKWRPEHATHSSANLRLKHKYLYVLHTRGPLNIPLALYGVYGTGMQGLPLPLLLLPRLASKVWGLFVSPRGVALL